MATTRQLALLEPSRGDTTACGTRPTRTGSSLAATAFRWRMILRVVARQLPNSGKQGARMSSYLKTGRLADVLALIQVLALDTADHRSEEGLHGELEGV